MESGRIDWPDSRETARWLLRPNLHWTPFTTSYTHRCSREIAKYRSPVRARKQGGPSGSPDCSGTLETQTRGDPMHSPICPLHRKRQVFDTSRRDIRWQRKPKKLQGHKSNPPHRQLRQSTWPNTFDRMLASPGLRLRYHLGCLGKATASKI